MALGPQDLTGNSLFQCCLITVHFLGAWITGYRDWIGVQSFISRCFPICVQFTRFGNFCYHWTWHSAGGKCHQGSLWCHYAPGPCWGLSQCSGSSQVARIPYSGEFVAGHFACLGLESILWFGICCQLWGRTTSHSCVWATLRCTPVIGSLLLIQCLLGDLPWIFVPHLLLASPSPLHYFIWESYFFFCKLASD